MTDRASIAVTAIVLMLVSLAGCAASGGGDEPASPASGGQGGAAGSAALPEGGRAGAARPGDAAPDAGASAGGGGGGAAAAGGATGGGGGGGDAMVDVRTSPPNDAGGDARPRDDGGTTPSPDGGPLTRPELATVCTPVVEYVNQLPASAGGKRFDMHVPDVVATMQRHARAVCARIYRTPEEVRRVPKLKLVIDSYDGVAYASGGEIHFGAAYIAGIRGDDQAVSFEINGVLAHETTHLYQHAAGGGGALVEAVADYVRFKTGWDRLARRRPGGKWSDAYTTGGFFISWIEDTVDKDFGYKVNMGMRDRAFSYPALVKEVSGKDIDTLWSEYQTAIR